MRSVISPVAEMSPRPYCTRLVSVPTPLAPTRRVTSRPYASALRPVIENKGLTGFSLPPDPPEPLESRDGRTYCARGAIYDMYMAYWLREVPDMSRTAKVFMTNRSQAVRLPKEFQFATDEVMIRKVGDDVIL